MWIFVTVFLGGQVGVMGNATRFATVVGVVTVGGLSGLLLVLRATGMGEFRSVEGAFLGPQQRERVIGVALLTRITMIAHQECRE